MKWWVIYSIYSKSIKLVSSFAEAAEFGHNAPFTRSEMTSKEKEPFRQISLENGYKNHSLSKIALALAFPRCE